MTIREWSGDGRTLRWGGTDGGPSAKKGFVIIVSSRTAPDPGSTAEIAEFTSVNRISAAGAQCSSDERTCRRTDPANDLRVPASTSTVQIVASPPSAVRNAILRASGPVGHADCRSHSADHCVPTRARVKPIVRDAHRSSSRGRNRSRSRSLRAPPRSGRGLLVVVPGIGLRERQGR